MKIIPLFLFFISFALQASDVCYNVQLSEQIFLCSKKTFENSDIELNKTYKTVLSTVRKEYNSQPDLKTEFVEKIKNAQKAWITFRDTNCVVYSFQIDESSQAYETSMYSCKNDMTRRRIEELNGILGK